VTKGAVDLTPDQRQILYTARARSFAGQSVPLGGGAAVCEQLVREWTATKPFPFRLITPAILGIRSHSK